MTLRVWIIDDLPEIVDGLRDLLTVDGKCEVVAHATSEREALEWSFQNEAGFDVAIVDLLLHEGSGFFVLAHLQKYQPGKVIVLSEYVSPTIAERCKKLGAAAAFPKSKVEECIRFVMSLEPD